MLIMLGRKRLQSSLLNAQDTMKISEFQVTHRNLYTPADQLPIKDILDRRLVRWRNGNAVLQNSGAVNTVAILNHQIISRSLMFAN
jgi:hypothetical protein